MDIIDKIFSLGAVGSTTIVLCGAMLIAFIGYALGSIKIKGVSLGTAGVFLMALLFGYLFTLPVLKDVPIIGKFFIEDAAAGAVSKYKMLSSIGLVLFVTAVGFIAGPSFFKNLKKKFKIAGAALLVSVICGSVWFIANGSPFNVGSELGTYTKVTIQTNITEADLKATGQNDVTIDFGETEAELKAFVTDRKSFSRALFNNEKRFSPYSTA